MAASSSAVIVTGLRFVIPRGMTVFYSILVGMQYRTEYFQTSVRRTWRLTEGHKGL
jgi:hypothetical protein